MFDHVPESSLELAPLQARKMPFQFSIDAEIIKQWDRDRQRLFDDKPFVKSLEDIRPNF